jgi:hypothetical protein
MFEWVIMYNSGGFNKLNPFLHSKMQFKLQKKCDFVHIYVNGFRRKRPKHTEQLDNAEEQKLRECIMNCRGRIGSPLVYDITQRVCTSIHMSWMLMSSYQGCVMQNHL